jgi:hypothetical protein
MQKILREESSIKAGTIHLLFLLPIGEARVVESHHNLWINLLCLLPDVLPWSGRIRGLLPHVLPGMLLLNGERM